MAIASAKAEAISIGTKILPEASGLRPIASIALEPIFPIAIAGAIEPTAIANAFANTEYDATSISIYFFFILTNNN